jgi:hypothetical protein
MSHRLQRLWGAFRPIVRRPGSGGPEDRSSHALSGALPTSSPEITEDRLLETPHSPGAGVLRIKEAGSTHRCGGVALLGGESGR